MNEHEAFEEKFTSIVYNIDPADLSSDETTTAIKNLKTFAESRPPRPEPDPIPEFVPTTTWEKVRHGTSAALDNETTRVLIKAAGAFAGVWLVVQTTIKRDHILEKQALGQANTSPK